MKKRVLAVSLVFALLLSLMPAQLKASAAIRVKIDASSSVDLVNVNLMPGDQHQILSFDLKYTNSGKRPLDLTDYWSRVTTKQGNSYSVQLHPEDKAYNFVAPGSSVTIRYFSKVGHNLKLSDFIIQLIEFDFSLPNYERTIGKFTLSSSVNVTKANTSRLFEVKGTPIYSKVKEFSAYEGSADAESTFDGTLVLFNNGRRTITVPEYRLLLMTSNGLLYPLETKSHEEGTTINPKSYKTYQFSGVLPAGVPVKGAQLLLVQELETSTGKVEVAAGTYELINGIGLDTGDAGNAASKLQLKKQDGQYEITIRNISQSPWEIQDVIVVELEVKNQKEAIAPIPRLEGSIKLDNGTWLPMTTVANENESEIRPNDSTSVFMVGKIPSNSTYETATVLLKEQVTDAQTRTIGQIKAERKAAMVPLSPRETWTTETYGLHTSYQIIRSGVYEGTYDDIYLAQVAIRNNDYRARELTAIAGFFKTLDGKLFRAEISEMEGVQTADKSRIVNLWATIPKDLDIRNMQLIFGEAISKGKLAGKGEQPDAMIQSVRYRLTEFSDIKNAATGIEVAPFTLNIKQFSSVLDLSEVGQNQLTVKFSYELVKNLQYTNDTEDRRFAIAIAYDGGKTTFEQTLAIDTEGKSTDSVLQPGVHQITLTQSLPRSIPLHFYDDLELYIYEEFKGYKKLIAKKPFVLYNYHDWSNE